MTDQTAYVAQENNDIAEQNIQLQQQIDAVLTMCDENEAAGTTLIPIAHIRSALGANQREAAGQ